MKKIYSCLLILTFFASCTSESPLAYEETIPINSQKPNPETLPLYQNNLYDYVGVLHDALFESYYEGENLPTTLSDIALRVDSIAQTNTTFKSIKGLNYRSLTVQDIKAITEHTDTCVADIIASSSLTTPAQLSLSDFMNSALTFFPTELNGDAIGDFVLQYENTVSSNPLFTPNDKRLILITTSVARHSMCMARKKPKKNTDPDWIIFVGNIISATKGGEEGSAKAVTLALATGIAQNL